MISEYIDLDEEKEKISEPCCTCGSHGGKLRLCRPGRCPCVAAGHQCTNCEALKQRACENTKSKKRKVSTGENEKEKDGKEKDLGVKKRAKKNPEETKTEKVLESSEKPKIIKEQTKTSSENSKKTKDLRTSKKTRTTKKKSKSPKPVGDGPGVAGEGSQLVKVSPLS